MSDYYELLTARLMEQEVKEPQIVTSLECFKNQKLQEEENKVEITLKMNNLISMAAAAGSFGESRKLHWKAAGMVLDQALVSLPKGLSQRTTTENELLATSFKKFIASVHREVSLHYTSINGKPWTAEILFKFCVGDNRLDIYASSSRYQVTPGNHCVEVYNGISVTISI